MQKLIILIIDQRSAIHLKQWMNSNLVDEIITSLVDF